jgi:hypothetical protein
MRKRFRHRRDVRHGGDPGGTFTMGSPANEPGRAADGAAPGSHRAVLDGADRNDLERVRRVCVRAVHRERGQRPATAPPAGADAITRPSPPYGDESFGFGKGRQPAINVQHHAAMDAPMAVIENRPHVSAAD